MLRRVHSVFLSISLVGALHLHAQTTCGSYKLACLLPTALHSNPPTFNFFNQTFATQIGQLPLATPASGFIYTFDKRTGVNGASQESFGPLVAERAETIGAGKLFVAFTTQRFAFDELDGNNLGNLKVVFFYPTTGTGAQVVTQTTDRIDAKLLQYVTFISYGLSKNFDISVAVPINRVSLGVSTSGNEYSVTTPATVAIQQQFLGGEASGFGDVVLAGKETLYKHQKLGIAAGGELRLPTGDDQNLLGSGAVGIKPYLVLARSGKIAPHINLLYQWNASSALTKNSSGTPLALPHFFGYTVGVDIGAYKPITFTADLVGQHFFNAPRITTPQTISVTSSGGSVLPSTLSGVQPFTSDYDVANLALGLKANPWKKLLLIGNATIKLNDGGLRASVVPLIGASYSF